MNQDIENYIDEQEEERQIDEMIESKIDDLRATKYYISKLSDKEKLELLKNFLDDETHFRAMTDTFHETELIKYIDNNIGIMIEDTKLIV